MLNSAARAVRTNRRSGDGADSIAVPPAFAAGRGRGRVSYLPVLQQMPLSQLAQACEEETARYLRREPGPTGYCHELFRRAICDHDDRAWEKVIGQFRRMVLAWIRRHPDYPAVDGDEDADHWVDAVFVRFWKAIQPERFGQFGESRHLLAYLKLCANSVIQDELRQRQSSPRGIPLGPADDEGAPEDYRRAIELDDPPNAQLDVEELLSVVRRLLRDERERQVFELSIRLGFTPREITRRDPERFPTVDLVYQTKRNLLERLRRSPEILTYLFADERSGSSARG